MNIHHQQRPIAFKELIDHALDNLYDETKSLKHHLKLAERHRRNAKTCESKGDLENAFIHFACSAVLVLDKLPTHREYFSMLNGTQRHNMEMVSAPAQPFVPILHYYPIQSYPLLSSIRLTLSLFLPEWSGHDGQD